MASHGVEAQPEFYDSDPAFRQMFGIAQQRDCHDDSLGTYLHESRLVPLLTAQEEIALAKRIESRNEAIASLQNTKDPVEHQKKLARIQDGWEARQHLIMANTRLVVSIAKRNQHRGVPLIDLIQEGNIGLIRAATQFDWRRGFRFSTYAGLGIRFAIIHAIDKESRRMGDCSSLDVPLGRDNEDARNIGMYIKDPNAIKPDEHVEEQILKEVIRGILGKLSARAERVLNLHYGLLDGERIPFSLVANRMGRSKNSMWEIEKKAFTILRNPNHPFYRTLRGYLQPEE